MKFQVREGFVCTLVRLVDVGSGKLERQETNMYGGSVVDLTAEDAALHGHKLEGKDDAASAWLDAKVHRVAATTLSTGQEQSLAEQVATLMTAQGADPQSVAERVAALLQAQTSLPLSVPAKAASAATR